MTEYNATQNKCGSEIRIILDFKWLKKGGLQMVWVLNGIHSNLAAFLSKTIRNLDKNVKISNGLVSYVWDYSCS